MTFLDGLWWLLMGFDGFWWVSMSFDGSWWVLVAFMVFDEFWWVLMGLDEFWWVLMALDGFLWVLMVLIFDEFWWVLMGFEKISRRKKDAAWAWMQVTQRNAVRLLLNKIWQVNSPLQQTLNGREKIDTPTEARWRRRLPFTMHWTKECFTYTVNYNIELHLHWEKTTGHLPPPPSKGELVR